MNEDDLHRSHYELRERVSVLETVVAEMGRKLSSIDGHLSKIVWLVLALLVSAIVKVVLDGGVT